MSFRGKCNCFMFRHLRYLRSWRVHLVAGSPDLSYKLIRCWFRFLKVQNGLCWSCTPACACGEGECEKNSTKMLRWGGGVVCGVRNPLLNTLNRLLIWNYVSWRRRQDAVQKSGLWSCRTDDTGSTAFSNRFSTSLRLIRGKSCTRSAIKTVDQPDY